MRLGKDSAIVHPWNSTGSWAGNIVCHSKSLLCGTISLGSRGVDLLTSKQVRMGRAEAWLLGEREVIHSGA